MGGASVYEALPLTHRLYITLRLHDTGKQADAFFPEIDEKVWKETSREDHHTDEKHLYPCGFISYERIEGVGNHRRLPARRLRDAPGLPTGGMPDRCRAM